MSHSLHALHRARFLDLLAARDAVAIIPTATTKTRNDDADYKFRPTSDFWYLTGLNEPGACLVLLPGKDGEEPRSVLFLRERDKLRRSGTGAASGWSAPRGPWAWTPPWTSRSSGPSSPGSSRGASGSCGASVTTTSPIAG